MMIDYEIRVQTESDGNFLNLGQLDAVKTIELVGHDRQGNELYRVETSTKIDQELDLISGVLQYKAGPAKPARLTSINPTTGETIKEYTEMSSQEVGDIITRADASFRTWRKTELVPPAPGWDSRTR